MDSWLKNCWVEVSGWKRVSCHVGGVSVSVLLPLLLLLLAAPADDDDELLGLSGSSCSEYDS